MWGMCLQPHIYSTHTLLVLCSTAARVHYSTSYFLVCQPVSTSRALHSTAHTQHEAAADQHNMLLRSGKMNEFDLLSDVLTAGCELFAAQEVRSTAMLLLLLLHNYTTTQSCSKHSVVPVLPMRSIDMI